jgi:GntR family transcriptional repressor for pyruvate dehydrogenase complex
MRKISVFNSIRVEPLSTRIVSQVLEALFTKKLKAGQFLGTEAQLTEMFKTSRMPIREALGRLEALGVLQVKAGATGGATIAQGEPDQFATALAVQFALIEATAEEIFDARIAIETRAAELAAQNATPEMIDRLEELLKAIKKRDAEGRPAVETILDFHTAIVETSGSRTLKALMHGLSQPLVSLYTTIPAQLTGKETRYRGLSGILARIKARDSKGAHERMHDHLVAQRDRIVKDIASMATIASAETDNPV